MKITVFRNVLKSSGIPRLVLRYPSVFLFVEFSANDLLLWSYYAWIAIVFVLRCVSTGFQALGSLCPLSLQIILFGRFSVSVASQTWNHEVHRCQRSRIIDIDDMLHQNDMLCKWRGRNILLYYQTMSCKNRKKNFFSRSRFWHTSQNLFFLWFLGPRFEISRTKNCCVKTSNSNMLWHSIKHLVN